MGISIVLALLIGRAIRSMPNVPLGARPPLPVPRPRVLVPLAVAGTLSAMAVFALAAPTLDPGATRSDVADGALLPVSLPPTLPVVDGARDRPKSAPRSASPT